MFRVTFYIYLVLIGFDRTRCKYVDYYTAVCLAVINLVLRDN